MTEHTVLAS